MFAFPFLNGGSQDSHGLVIPTLFAPYRGRRTCLARANRKPLSDLGDADVLFGLLDAGRFLVGSQQVCAGRPRY